MDAIFIMKQIKEKTIKYNTPAYICFIDLTKAFDTVRHNDVIQTLMQKKTQSKVMKVIKKNEQ